MGGFRLFKGRFLFRHGFTRRVGQRDVKVLFDFAGIIARPFHGDGARHADIGRRDFILIINGVIGVFCQNDIAAVIVHRHLHRRFNGGSGVGIRRVDTGDIGICNGLGKNIKFAVFRRHLVIQADEVDREGPFANVGVIAVGHGVILAACHDHVVDFDHRLRFNFFTGIDLISHGINGDGVGRAGGDDKAYVRGHILFGGGSTAGIHNGDRSAIRPGGQTGHRFDFVCAVVTRNVAGSRCDFGHGGGIVNDKFIAVHSHGFYIGCAIAVVADGDGFFVRCITNIRFVEFHGICREHRFAGFIDSNGANVAGKGRFRCQITDFIQTRCQTAEAFLLLFSGNSFPFPVGSAVFHLGGHAGNGFGIRVIIDFIRGIDSVRHFHPVFVGVSIGFIHAGGYRTFRHGDFSRLAVAVGDKERLPRNDLGADG